MAAWITLGWYFRAVALAINLGLDPHNAEKMAAKGQLRQLVRRAVQSQDNCLLKLVRNISAHNLPYREEFREYVDEMLSMCMRCDNHDVLVEVLGIVSNMNSSCCDLEGLTHKHDLGNWLKKFMVPVRFLTEIVDDFRRFVDEIWRF